LQDFISLGQLEFKLSNYILEFHILIEKILSVGTKIGVFSHKGLDFLLNSVLHLGESLHCETFGLRFRLEINLLHLILDCLFYFSYRFDELGSLECHDAEVGDPFIDWNLDAFFDF
jgi:hypothetical protein